MAAVRWDWSQCDENGNPEISGDVVVAVMWGKIGRVILAKDSKLEFRQP